MKKIFFYLIVALMLSSCTQESQNRIGKAMQNYTGTNGVLEIYAANQKVKQFIAIDKLSTPNTQNGDRAYRYGYGVLDKNFNYKKDEGEKKVYFEFGTFDHYVFYENVN